MTRDLKKQPRWEKSHWFSDPGGRPHKLPKLAKCLGKTVQTNNLSGPVHNVQNLRWQKSNFKLLQRSCCKIFVGPSHFPSYCSVVLLMFEDCSTSFSSEREELTTFLAGKDLNTWFFIYFYFFQRITWSDFSEVLKKTFWVSEAEAITVVFDIIRWGFVWCFTAPQSHPIEKTTRVQINTYTSRQCFP